MADLARPIPRPSAPKSKVLVVRQSIKSVRRSDEPDRLPVRLAIGVIAAAGAVSLLWLLGHVGFRLGFAQLMGVGELRGDLADGIITGTMMLIAIPRVVIKAGVAQPLWMMLGFVIICIPAASLSAARPATPGAPRPAALSRVLSVTGSVLCLLCAGLLLWWAVSPARLELLRELPRLPVDGEAWLRDLQTAAGLDVLAAIAAALWVVLAMRLMIPLWLRALCAAASLFALVVVAVAMSISNAAAAQVEAGRSLVFLGDGSVEPRLILGHTPTHLAALSIVHVPAGPIQKATTVASMQLLDSAAPLEVIGRQSVVEMLRQGAATPER